MVVTDEQVRALREWLGKEASLAFAAAKAGMDRKTAGKHRRARSGCRRNWQQRAPGERAWRTRTRSVRRTSGARSRQQLKEGSGWEAKTLLEELQRRHPGRLAEGANCILPCGDESNTGGPRAGRTRRFSSRSSASQAGPGRLGFHAHEPNWARRSTVKVVRAHLLYHFVLTHSNWEHATVCFSESFESFAEGFQNAVWALGGAPAEHRSDRMSLAVQASGSQFFTRRYEAVMAHYRVRPPGDQCGQGS